MERYLKLVGILLAVILSPVWIWATLSFIGAAVVIPLMLMNVECHCMLDRLCESNETFVREAWKVGLAVVLIITKASGLDTVFPSTQHCEHTCRKSKWRDSSSGAWCYDITKTTPLACSITEIKRVKA